jgi:hypothetical protein
VPEDFEAEEDLAEELLWVQYQLSCLRKTDPEDAADDSHVSTYASDETRSETGTEISFVTESAESSWALESHVSGYLCVLEADECSISSSWQREGFLEPDESSISSSWQREGFWYEEDTDSDEEFFK